VSTYLADESEKQAKSVWKNGRLSEEESAEPDRVTSEVNAVPESWLKEQLSYFDRIDSERLLGDGDWLAAKAEKIRQKKMVVIGPCRAQCTYRPSSCKTAWSALSTRVLGLERELLLANPVSPIRIQETLQPAAPNLATEPASQVASKTSGWQPIDRLSHDLESRVLSFLSDLSMSQLHCVSRSWHEAAKRADNSKKPAMELKTNKLKEYYERLDDVDLFG
jgi:hypothetical protein